VELFKILKNVFVAGRSGDGKERLAWNCSQPEKSSGAAMSQDPAIWFKILKVY
jgi:hypothetical protein